MNIKLSLTIALACGLAGCQQAGHPAPHFGEAVMHNIAVQTVNPGAPQDKGPIAYEGERAALAQKRYEANKVEKPADISTSTIMTGGPNGNSGGSK